MKRHLLTLILTLSAAAAFAAEEQPPAVPVAVAAPAETAPAPKLTCFVNGTSQSELLRGWPMILQVTVEHSAPDAPDAKPVTLASKKGDWTKLIRVEFSDAEGTVYVLPFEAAPLVKPEPKITLTKGKSASLVYLLDAQSTKK